MDGVKNLSCTHLLYLFRDMVRIKSHSGIVARDRIERDNRGIGTRNMQAVFDTSQHSGKQPSGTDNKSSRRYERGPSWKVGDSKTMDPA